MKLKNIAILILAKCVIKFLRLFKLGGTTFPGRIALKLNPKILTDLTKGFKIIMVTGTNGKTTTSKIISKMLSIENIEHISNISGANLVTGVTTTFIEGHTLFGTPKNNTALIEIDEAAFNKISTQVQPDFLVVTNFFRDQLDRYGELYTTLSGVKNGIINSPDTVLILNSDDSLCSSLAKNFSGKTIYYGFSKNAYTPTTTFSNTDANFCFFCKNEYKYSYHIYGHLGDFYCENCGYKQSTSSITCTKVEDLSAEYSKIKFKILSSEYSAQINLPGLYNIYNCLAAITCGFALNLELSSIVDSLSDFECGFGRMETISANNKNIKLILVKNPVGFNQVINYLLTETTPSQIAFLINDNLADGTDISWLWDVDFEELSNTNHSMITSGIRAEDMSVRLKYAGIDITKISMQKDYNKLLKVGLDNTADGHNFYILPTYTALLEIRKILKNKFNLKEFWK